MKFEEYMTAFKGNFLAEGRKLLGNHLKKYSHLQETLDSYPSLFTREEHLRNVQQFYRIAVRTGVKDLNTRTDIQAPWVADEINNAIKGKSVVDAGCCNGFFTIFYALNHPQSQFLGIDISEDALQAAQGSANRHQVRNIQWLCGDVLAQDVQAQFDNADTIILQDVLYQLFGSRDLQKERKILHLLAPHQAKNSIVIIGQEGNDIQKSFQERESEGYTLNRYEQKTLFDKISFSPVTCEVAVFCRRS